MVKTVVITNAAMKDLAKVPANVKQKLQLWSAAVEKHGLEEVRKVPGYHDEPLKGDRKGQRSIRLSKAYRGFYVISKDGSIEFVSVIEVNKHDY